MRSRPEIPGAYIGSESAPFGRLQDSIQRAREPIFRLHETSGSVEQIVRWKLTPAQKKTNGMIRFAESKISLSS